MNSVPLILIRNELQARMNYTDPDRAFNNLLFGFSRYICRHRLGTVDAVWQAKHRGYMSYAMANLFTDYCITGWRIC